MPALGRLAQDDDFLVFMSPEVAHLVGAQLPDNFQQQITDVTKRVGLRVLWEQVVLPRYLQAWQADVLFAPFDIAPLASPSPVLLAVRNPSPVLHGKTLALRTQVHRLLAYLSCRRARLVFYPSFYASKVLGDTMGVPLSKRMVVHHGTDHSIWSTVQEPFPVLDRYHIESQRYVLFVSQLYPYKRPDVLIDGFATWRRITGRTGYKLVLAGESPSRAFEQKLRQRVRELELEDVILFLGYVPGIHVAILYQQAAVFVLPTVMETFGHPFVEAMASGTPVVCADTEFARELCGDAVLYFPAGDAQALAHALEVVISQPSVAVRMREAGRHRAKMFSWDREARETLALLKRVGQNSTVAPKRELFHKIQEG